MSGSKVTRIRIMPYPPSFRRTAARTIEPAIGASTCALGSQRCTPYRGILTRNARMQPAHQILSAYVESWGGVVWRSVRRDRDPFEFCRSKRAIRRGREPARV